MATWIPRRITVAICRAMPCTTSGSTPTAPPPNTSPESLSTTRRGRKDGGVGSSTGLVCSVTIVMDPPSLLASQRPYATGRPGAQSRSRPPMPLLVLLLADLEPDEPGDVEARLVGDLLHGLLVVDHGGLLEQDEVLEEGVHPALDDLGQRLLGLALLLGGLLGDAALGVDDLGRHLVAGEEARAHGGDLHADAAGVGVAGLVGLAGVLHQNAHLRRQVLRLAVQVDGHRAVEVDEPVEDDLLADLGAVLLDGVRHRLAVRQRRRGERG